MSLKGAIYTALTADGTVSGLIGTRIYPVFATAVQTTPFLVYERDDRNDSPVLSGGRGVLFRESYNFQAFGNTVAVADQVMDAVIVALEAMQKTTVASTRLSAVFISSQSDGYETLIDGDQLPTFSEIITADFWFNKL